MDLYNRQLHPDEKKAIKDKANGDKAAEQRLTEAACYRVQCWAQYSPNSDAWAANYVSPEQAATLGPELQWVDSQKVAGGLFDYTPFQQGKDFVSSQVDMATRGAKNAFSDLVGLIKGNNGQTAPADADPLADLLNGGTPPPSAPSVVTPPVVQCVGMVCTVLPPTVVPGSSGYEAGNAIFNSGDGDGTSSNGGSSGNSNNVLTDNRATKIFGERDGHIADTPANRALLTDVANDPTTTLGTDKFGTVWSAKIQPDGTQVWVQTRNGQVWNGGVNKAPVPYNPETGLAAPTRPGWK